MKRFLPWLALLVSGSVYCAHFFFGGGEDHLIRDSLAYLQLADGQRVAIPFNTRLVTPLLAKLVAYTSESSTSAAFKLITPAALLTSLLLLLRLIRRRRGSLEWQAAVLLAFGSSIAASFGYTPVLADPMLLLLTCLTLVALDAGYLVAALALACLAALTKEYGVLLGFVVALHAHRSGFRKLQYASAIAPILVLSAATLAPSASEGVGFLDWRSFGSAMFGYHLSYYRLRGASDYFMILYMWSWTALWPALFISAAKVLSRLRNRVTLTDDELGFLVMLTALPFLLLGDWSRALLIVIPVACIVATAHPLSRDRGFVLLLALGGLSTTLARPFHSDPPPTQIFPMTMTVISAVSSVFIGIAILRSLFSKSIPRIEPGLDKSADELAVR